MFAPTTVGVDVRGTPATLLVAKGEMGDVVARDVAAMCAQRLQRHLAYGLSSSRC